MTVTEVALNKKANLAHVREEVSPPLEAVLYCTVTLLADARSHGLDGFIPDLEKIHTAATQLLTKLNGLMDPAALAAPDETDIDAFASKLRHDLRTPINAIASSPSGVACHDGPCLGDRRTPLPGVSWFG